MFLGYAVIKKGQADFEVILLVFHPIFHASHHNGLTSTFYYNNSRIGISQGLHQCFFIFPLYGNPLVTGNSKEF